MEMTSRQAALVDIRDFSDGITATIPRAEFAAALTSEEPAELFLELTRPESDDRTDVAVTWTRDELEQLLAATAGPTVTLAFKRDELETALDEPDVEMHGFRDKALILSVAAAAAVGGGASNAAAMTQDGGGSTAGGITPSYLAVHDEATLAARGIEAPVVASHDEATLAARGIETPVAASHDEATLAARGIQPTVAASHDEATVAARGIEPTVVASHDEATLAARGIEPTVVASHDEATLAARGIEPTIVASHDEATLASRGIRPEVVSHDEATLAARGIAPAPVSTAGDDGGISIEVPTIDATTAAVAGGLAGLGLLITAAGFATRRERGGGGPQPA